MEPPDPDELMHLVAHATGRPADLRALHRAGLVDDDGALTPAALAALRALRRLRDAGEAAGHDDEADEAPRGGGRGPPGG